MRSRRSEIACFALAVSLIAVCYPAPAIGSAARLVKLYPVYRGACPAPGEAPSGARELAFNVTGAHQCPELDPYRPGRRNEEYRLDTPLPGVLAPDSSIKAVIAFDETTAPVGYVDADIRLEVNGDVVLEESVAGTATADEPFVVELDARVPADLRSKAVGDAALRIEWNEATSPGVEPTMDRSSFVGVQLVNGAEGKLDVTFDRRPRDTSKCPTNRWTPQGRECIEWTGTGLSPSLGTIKLRRVQYFHFQPEPSDDPCSQYRTRGTLVLQLSGSRRASVSFESYKTFARPKTDPESGSIACFDVGFLVRFTGGTGPFRDPRGSARITVSDDRGHLEEWSGVLRQR